MAEEPLFKEEVMQHFRGVRGDLTELDKKLDQERRAIRLTAFQAGRRQTVEEIARRKEIAAERLEVADALEELALETIAGLDGTEDVQKILSSMALINAELGGDLQRLKQLEEYAALADKIMKGLVKGVAKLGKLAF